MTEDYDDFPDYIPNMGAWGESKPGDTPGERQEEERQAGRQTRGQRARGRGGTGRQGEEIKVRLVRVLARRVRRGDIFFCFVA